MAYAMIDIILTSFNPYLSESSSDESGEDEEEGLQLLEVSPSTQTVEMYQSHEYSNLQFT